MDRPLRHGEEEVPNFSTNATELFTREDTFEDLIRYGCYNTVERDFIPEYYVLDREETDITGKKAFLVFFNRDVTIQEVTQELDKMGLRPATIKEFLKLGVVCPKLQLWLTITTVGSSRHNSEGNLAFPYLSGWTDNRRQLRQIFMTDGGTINRGYHFFAIEK